MDADSTATQPAAVEVGAGLWAILPGREQPGPQALEGLRSAALSALDRGALDVLVEPGSIARSGIGSLDVLAALSDSLLARVGRLWLARAGGREQQLAFAPVSEGRLEALLQAGEPCGEQAGELRGAVTPDA